MPTTKSIFRFVTSVGGVPSDLLKANRLTEESESTLNRQRSKCMLTIPFCSRGHHLLFMSDLPYVRISAVALSSESFMVS